MLYPLIRSLLFLLPPEVATDVTLKILDLRELLFPYCPPAQTNPISVMGIDFPSRVGLAAGLDKNGACILPLAALGFGFVEVGTVTPLSQEGQPKPRIFRLPREKAVINRMGFPNLGVDNLVKNVSALKQRPILGINIGKNKQTPLADAIHDYEICFQKVYPYADYITLNISSPNTKDLRELQGEHHLFDLLTTLKNLQTLLSHQHERYVPFVVKIAPDLDDEYLKKMACIFLGTDVDGVIATNTTISRNGVENNPLSNEAGGMSGAPLKAQALHVVRTLHQELKGQVPIIGLGGIQSAQDAQDFLDAGASLVQIYTGLIYQGPGLIKDIASLPVS